MNIKNPYDYLKTECLEDVEPVEAQSTWTLTEGRREVITIFTSLLPDGSWVYGYSVYWANGRHSHQAPSAELGKFRSQRAAKLYAIGFMRLYQKYFTEDSNQALLRAEISLVQGNLF